MWSRCRAGGAEQAGAEQASRRYRAGADKHEQTQTGAELAASRCRAGVGSGRASRCRASRCRKQVQK